MSNLNSVSPETLNIISSTIARLYNDGYLKIFEGEIPADYKEASMVNLSTALVSVRFDKQATRSISNGVIEINKTNTGIVNKRGKPTWYAVYRSDEKTLIKFDSAGKTNSSLNLNTEYLEQDSQVTITGLRHIVSV